MKKRLFWGIALSVFCAALVVVLAGCDNPTRGNGPRYSPEHWFEFDEEGGLVASDAFPDGTTHISIPSSLGGIWVTAIGEWAFGGREEVGDTLVPIHQLTSVTIPNSITSIGLGAFSWNKITSITIPNSVVHIEDGAFFDNALTSVSIGNSVEVIAAGAFANNYLTSVVIPNNVTLIGVNAFGNNALTSVTIGNSVEHIGDRAFASNDLTSITIGYDVTIVRAPDWFTGQDRFGSSFDDYYESRGRTAGTYTYSNGVWSRN